jgi:phospholipid/cholesterol/gamma-HCH transport system substrate-binding protein
VKSFRERNQVVVGIVSILILGLIFLVAFDLKSLPFVSKNYKLTAEFADAAGLAAGDDVRVAGLKVGTVKSVKLAGDRVLVTLQIQNGIRIPRDAKIKISLKTILGTKSVVIDARGNGPYFADGSRVPLAQTEIPFEIYQAANGAVDLLTNVNGKLLNESLKALAKITTDPDRNLAGTLKGASKVLGTLGSKSGSLETVLAKGDQILESLDASIPDIEMIIRQSNVVLEVLARRRSVVQSLLKNTAELAGQLGGLLRDKRPDLDTILNDLHSTLAVVDANLGQLEEALRLIGPSSEAFARIVYRGRWAAVCIDAIQATALPPPLPVTLNIGTPDGAPSNPQDCDLTTSTLSTSAQKAGSR